MSHRIPFIILLGIMGLGVAVLIWFGVRDSAPSISDGDGTRQRTPAPRPGAARPVQPRPAPTHPWYEGGTLHDKTFGQWNTANARNRLATAGDWIASIQLSEYGEASDVDGSRMRVLATELRDCVSGTTAGAGPEYGLASKPVSEAAAMCLFMLWGRTPPRP